MYEAFKKIKWEMEKAAALFPFFPKPYVCSACKNRVSYMKDFGVKAELFHSMDIAGGGLRRRVLCPVCRANDRMRWIDFVIGQMTDIYTGRRRILHIAPEYCVERKIRQNRSAEYITGDIMPGKADRVVDLTAMKFPDSRFDYIIANHVLEHVEDEARAMGEIRCCLKDGGRFFFSVPVCLDRKTFAVGRNLSASERLAYYGQKDHCRLYGMDVAAHIEQYGFGVREYAVNRYLQEEEIREKRLLWNDRVYIAEKQKKACGTKNNGKG